MFLFLVFGTAKPSMPFFAQLTVFRKSMPPLHNDSLTFLIILPDLSDDENVIGITIFD